MEKVVSLGYRFLILSRQRKIGFSHDAALISVQPLNSQKTCL